jgi:hypothetical protein
VHRNYTAAPCFRLASKTRSPVRVECKAAGIERCPCEATLIIVNEALRLAMLELPELPQRMDGLAPLPGHAAPRDHVAVSDLRVHAIVRLVRSCR